MLCIRVEYKFINSQTKRFLFQYIFIIIIKLRRHHDRRGQEYGLLVIYLRSLVSCSCAAPCPNVFMIYVCV